MAKNNEGIAKNQADLATAAGSAEVETQGLKNRATIGAIKAGEAASNIDVNSGSALDVRSSAAELGELDALTIRSGAAQKSTGFQTAAAGYSGQAGLETSQAGYAPVAGAINAGGSLLSGATSAANQYLRWKSVAGPDATFF